jgi:phage major head subunit gpT-like protein
MQIDIFTAAMRSEFLKTMLAAATPAPYENFTTEIPSSARIENYAWMTPSPGIQRYLNRRRLAQLDQVKYTVENLEYDGSFSVKTRDIEDDIVGGYKLRMNDLTVKAKKPFVSRLVLTALAAGGTNICFDGSNFFGTTHTLGTAAAAPLSFTGGGNDLAFTSSNSSDGIVHTFCMLIHNGAVKPLVYQNRKPAKFMTDAGTPQSEKAKKADYWIDLEAAPAYGYWWDAIRVKITNTPSLLDIFTCIDACRMTFRRFKLPKALLTDPDERVHEQTELRPDTTTIVCSTGLEQLFNHALFEDRVGVSVAGSTAGITSNIYYRGMSLVVSGFLD